MRWQHFGLVGILAVASVASVGGQTSPGRIDPSKAPARPAHATAEYTLDAPSDPVRWAAVAPGLHAAFGSTDDVYLRAEVPGLEEGRGVEASAWRGERVNAIMVAWSSTALEDVRVEPGALSDGRGHEIPAAGVRVALVRYVISDHPPGARQVTCDAGPEGAWLLPDRLEPFAPFDVPARSVRPVWLSVDVPASAAPGRYTGAVRVVAGPAVVSLPVAIVVASAVLPPPRDWSFRLDLWQNPWAVAWHHQVEPWSAAHEALLRRHLTLYAEMGGKYVTTYAVHSPWQDNSYWIEGGMIEWIRDAGGRWRFDYGIFDRYVALAMEAGVDEAVTIYTPVPWGNRFRYIDQATSEQVEATWAPGSVEYASAWGAFLDDLRVHLAAKGWLATTYLGINEIDMPATRAAIDVIRRHSKDWRITYAGDWHAELDALVDDYSSVIPKEPGRAAIDARRTRGATSTFYVCCTPPAPNTFVFSPPVEGRWLGWYAAARGYDGLLRWAWDAWPADPARDARHVLWPAGDTFVVYPDGQRSVRYERLREGIVDFEKLRLVRARASQSGEPAVERELAALDRELAAIGAEPAPAERDLRATVARASDALAALAARVMP
jgi:hypothetical protein